MMFRLCEAGSRSSGGEHPRLAQIGPMEVQVEVPEDCRGYVRLRFFTVRTPLMGGPSEGHRAAYVAFIADEPHHVLSESLRRESVMECKEISQPPLEFVQASIVVPKRARPYRCPYGMLQWSPCKRLAPLSRHPDGHDDLLPRFQSDLICRGNRRTPSSNGRAPEGMHIPAGLVKW
jgi:hypothetical protein